MTRLNENAVELEALDILSGLGYSYLFGPSIAPGEPAAERLEYGQVVLEDRLREALARLNPKVPDDALDEAFRKLTRPDLPTLSQINRAMHRLIVEGVNVEYQHDVGGYRGDYVHVMDFENPENNDFLAVNQYTVVENGIERRPDIILFINGLPVADIELKNPADEEADIWKAFGQIQTYKEQISSLFHHNSVLVISDGITARVGSLTADKERFMPWRTIEGDKLADKHVPQLEIVLKGVFDPQRLLNLIRYFTVFEEDHKGNIVKKLAGYHQYHAVNQAVASTVNAAGSDGDQRVGVVWHTQGSGKSLTMAFYAGRVILHPAMENPTIVVITDRNDLDDQLFGTFARCKDILRQEPVQAENRDDLREKLKVASGGVVFTTVQKFFPIKDEEIQHPLLSDRRNIVIIADEAHRTQYGFVKGFARHMRDALPNASFIGFTGTPVDLADRQTRAVFGDYISIYDIEQAKDDQATVPIFYESRLAKLDLNEEERPHIDPEFEEITENEEAEDRERLRSKWAALEALVGSEKRIKLVAQDLVTHWAERLAAMRGKAMIVCMSRRICVELYKELVRLKPEWHGSTDETGAIKVVMTGSATDPVDWQQHIRNKPRREKLAERFKDPSDPFELVIVRDMWLTGFDAPCLHTMYTDKPMRGHGLMQAIARVNRVFKDKPGGLVVDYLGLAQELKVALATYTTSGGEGKPTIDQEEAVQLMLEKYEVCCGIMHGFDWSKWITSTTNEKLSMLIHAQEHVLDQDNGKVRFFKAVADLSKAFALAVPHEEALRIRDDVGFFQAVKAQLSKGDPDEERPPFDMEHAIRQLISRAVSSEGVVDIFAAAGLKKPDISILSDEFLAEVRALPQRNLAVETLRKLLKNEIKNRSRHNIVQARSFATMLEESITRYHNRAVETAQVIEELIALAKDIRAADQRGEELGLTPDEVAFYDALEVNDSAVKVLGDDNLRLIAQELVTAVRNSVSVDWTVRENVRAGIRVVIKRILKKYGYPPDKQAKATELVLEQAETLCAGWAVA